ncbi:melanoma antigen preferentially expressed in tumors-like [Talpa occidentalis]|uniref:melanoma antigen preferentially expressed in tumors-like n=1 Tax=Talpa occidentalis TaxID=50954 RepID=UPI0023F71369|nr:melanoma antigen preferentially expressed in tumors-like [Talpa occidentalis]XP_054551612.1 melanoma antigen preferentially expressed in tumors-like [Talpa occidentalis]
MAQKSAATLLQLAAKSLLSNEPAAIHALGELPRDIFVPLFNAAFLGGHKETLKAMVRVWPFYCLHIGALSVQETCYEVLEAMVDGLQLLPTQDSSSWGTKLKILDLRQDLDCETTCSDKSTHSFCFQSCIYSDHSILKIEEAQHNVRCLGIGDSESVPQSVWEPLELVMDISFNDAVKAKHFLSFLRNKVEQSFGSLHLCCRNLQIDKMSALRSNLQFLDMGCIDHLEVDDVLLNEVSSILSQMSHLESLNLSNIPFKSCKGRNLRTFLTCLGRLESLQELNLSCFCLTNQLHRLLRVLPPQLDTLCLSFSDLSKRDITVLSQSSHATHLRLLNLSNNQIFWDVDEPFLILLEKLSGTLQHLEINNCLITDGILTTLITTLSQCSQLRVFSFAFNPVTMPALVNLLQQLTAMKELKFVIYPVPIHCYEQGNFHGNVDHDKFAEVQTQLKEMLQEEKREDMSWTTYLD